MATYELFLCNDRGRRLMPLNNLQSFAAAKVVNATAPFRATLRAPANLTTLQNYHYVERNIRPDWQVQVWRKVRGPLKLWNSYFILDWGWAQGEDGGEVFDFGGFDVNHLLTRRVVAAYEGETQAGLSAVVADDGMKTVVTNSMLDNALPVPTAGTRAWGDLGVGGNHGNGPAVTLDFAFDQLLTLSGGGVLPEIAAAADEAGTPVYFWIVPAVVSTSSAKFGFRTYTGQPGHDRTTGKGQVIFDADLGTLTNWSYHRYYHDVANAMYGLHGDRALHQQAYRTVGWKRSYWGRCEGAVNANDQETATGVLNVARAEARARRAYQQLRGDPVSTPGQAFGRHYDVGDKVIAKAKGRSFDAIVWSGMVGLSEDGQTTESVRLEATDEQF